MNKVKALQRRKKSIRKKVSGSTERPRMCLHKTNKYINVQIINDLEGKTICSLSTSSAALKDKLGTSKKDVAAATALGEELAKVAVSRKVTKIVFDRSGYRYHGVVKALADSARKNGLDF